jgi:spermidine/putrescine-binding protein
MIDFLNEERFDYMSNHDKEFVLAFNDAMNQLGYDFGNEIGSGYCWGKYMLIYRKAGVKSKNVYARIYIRDESVVLRLFFNAIDQHRQYIENAPPYIKTVFVGDAANCQHCHNEKDGVCRFRKTYTIDDRRIEKCNGITFEFHNPSIPRIPDYMALFTEFYPGKQR